MQYKISLNGCDDSTVFPMELTIDEFTLLKRVELMSLEASTYGCMPKFRVELIKEE